MNHYQSAKQSLEEINNGILKNIMYRKEVIYMKKIVVVKINNTISQYFLYDIDIK